MPATEAVDIVVIGAGQAGLAVSHELTELGIDHLVLERGRVGQSWRGRWDSFCLVTPNWTVQLPGHPYDGQDPDGYMPRDDIVAYLERYGKRLPLVREGVTVTSLRAPDSGQFLLETNEGTLKATKVVVCTGAYQRPHRPAAAASVPPDVYTIDVEGYRNADALPAGNVLVVGSGQSGCQIAEELHQAGRTVVLACGRAPWTPRRIGDRDFVWWAVETGYLDTLVGQLPDASARLWANGLATGHGGGHDLHLRTLDSMGVTLTGHFLGVDGGMVRFASDLSQTIAWGDVRYAQFMELVRKTAGEKQLPVPPINLPAAFNHRSPEALGLARFGAIIFAGGFRPDYGRWIDLAGAFDAVGFPLHREGASVVPGLYFVGVHFLRKRKSTLLYGVGEDATIVARSIARAAVAPN